MAIERDTDDAVTPAPAAGRRYNHKQSPGLVSQDSMPPHYIATLAGTEDGQRVAVSGEPCDTPEEATASAWEALRVWALAGRVPV